MDGRLIQCLRSKYVDTSLTFDSQCITELIDVIQTYKLNAKLYSSCRKYLTDNPCKKIFLNNHKIIDF